MKINILIQKVKIIKKFKIKKKSNIKPEKMKFYSNKIKKH